MHLVRTLSDHITALAQLVLKEMDSCALTSMSAPLVKIIAQQMQSASIFTVLLSATAWTALKETESNARISMNATLIYAMKTRPVLTP